MTPKIPARTVAFAAAALTGAALTTLATPAQAATASTVVLQGKKITVSSPVTVGVGQVAWSDDSAARRPVLRRSLSTASGVLTAGTTTTLGQGRTAKTADEFAEPSTASVSGSRIAWTTQLDSTGVESLTISTVNGQRVTLRRAVAGDPQLSGTRLLYGDVKSGHDRIYNLLTKKTIDLTTRYGLNPRFTPSLAGDFVAYAKADGSIWRVDIAHGSKPVRVAGPSTSKVPVAYVRVYAYGDYVAWTRELGRPDGDDISSVGGFRNARTLTKAVTVSKRYPVAVGTGGVVLQRENSFALSMRPWTSTTPIALPATDGQTTPSTYGSLVAYTGTDGKPRVTRLATALPARPRSLGNVSHTATVAPGRSWSLRLVATAAPSSCSVLFRNAKGKAVAAVGCDKAFGKYGEIRATWDATVHGKRVPAGTYSWTVRAANGSGTLVGESGSTSATGGTLTVAK